MRRCFSRLHDWIPHPRETEVLEVFDVHRGEVSNSVCEKSEGGTSIVESAKSEGARTRLFPQRIVYRSALGGESDEPPTWMFAVSLNDLDGFGRFKRMAEHGWIAQQAVEFGQKELRDGHFLLTLNRGQPAKGGCVFRRVLVERVKQYVRINREHDSSDVASVATRRLRRVSSAPALSVAHP